MAVDRGRTELLGLHQVFAEGQRAFVVPDYQRGYSWEDEQRSALLEDIEYAEGAAHQHFTGTIVASKSGDGSNGVEYFDIVDGQQRLTSLVILISELLRYSGQKAHLDEATARTAREMFVCSGRATGNTVRKLTLSGNLDDCFWAYLEGGEAGGKELATKAHANIAAAVEQFRKWIGTTSLGPMEVYRTITARLGFLLYAPQDGAETGMMFEVINNRGKPLSELEKIKNYLVYYAERAGIADLKHRVNSSWGNILANLNAADHTSNDAEDSFLRNCWIVYHDTSKSRSHHVYESMKTAWPVATAERGSWEKLIAFVAFLEEGVI